MKASMHMVTLMKTLDVTPLVRLRRKRGYKFHMLLCWCIGKAAATVLWVYRRRPVSVISYGCRF